MAKVDTALVANAALTTSAATVYTSPTTNPVAVIRHIHVTNTAGAAGTFTLSIGADAAGTRIFALYPIGAQSSLDFYGMWVLPSNTVLQALASATTINLMVNGQLEYAG